MQSQNCQPLSCIQCKVRLRGTAMRYLLSDMAEEMLAWVELKLKLEVNEHSCLCEKCFTDFRNTWAAIQEPEVMNFTEPDVQNPDPLSGVQFLTEGVQVKSEETKSFEHYDYKVEIDTSEPLEQDSNIINTNIKPFHVEGEDEDEIYKPILEDNKVEEEFDDEKKSSDNEPDNDMIESLSDAEISMDSLIPPALDGSSLKHGSKCDWCQTLLKNKQYRKLPDGPEKQIIVNRTFNRYREKSPDRVCNACWNKAHAAAYIENKDKKQAKQAELTQAVDTDVTINVPGYQRLANTSHKCFVHGCKSNERLKIPHYLKLVLLKSYNLYAPDNARVCGEHSKEYQRDWSFLKEKPYLTYFSAKDVTGMLDLLREEALKHPD